MQMYNEINCESWIINIPYLSIYTRMELIEIGIRTMRDLVSWTREEFEQIKIHRKYPDSSGLVTPINQQTISEIEKMFLITKFKFGIPLEDFLKMQREEKMNEDLRD